MEEARLNRNLLSRFRKRRIGIMKKAYALSTICGADVAVIIRREERFYTYRSKNDNTWPPSMKDIV
jgi:hypothetical protein